MTITEGLTDNELKEVNMVVRKLALLLIFLAFYAVNIFAQNSRTTVEITGVNIGGGNIHICIFSNERDYKKGVAFREYVLESQNTVLRHEADLPYGEYVFMVFQDTNGNGKMDTNFLGMPKEPVSLFNHTGGIPGGFNKLKAAINREEVTITMNMKALKGS